MIDASDESERGEPELVLRRTRAPVRSGQPAAEGDLAGLEARVVSAYEDASDSVERPVPGVEWLLTPNQTLGMARPVDLLSDADGVDRVQTTLARIRHGSVGRQRVRMERSVHG
ncbi:MbcA/ParS/Xre antitoxin family protein [Paraburkholderia guartelaensis]|uniref:MbcA/ParS/Xre antitoxin family protein n=1 Tax=Paraburkholderia guartelaensis TaxID=2546446 RepID=UPI0038BB699A